MNNCNDNVFDVIDNCNDNVFDVIDNCNDNVFDVIVVMGWLYNLLFPNYVFSPLCCRW